MYTSKNLSTFGPLALVLSALYLSQGLPGGFIGHALPTLLREAGVSLELIGALKLLALPWLLKFLWAPLIDKQASGQGRRYWIFGLQLASASTLIALSLLVADGFVLSIGVVISLLMANLFASTQDIATDGMAVSQTPQRWRGLANSIQVVGYKVGMLAGGGGLMFLTAYTSASTLISSMAFLLLCCLIPLWLFKSENDERGQQLSSSTGNPFKDYKGFFGRTGIWPWVAVLLTYKVADSLGSDMLKPMLIDAGYEVSEVGSITLTASMIGMLGALAGGFLYKKLGLFRSLIIFGIAQTMTVSSFYFIAEGYNEYSTVATLVSLEQFADGMSTVALFAGMMSQCRSGHEGADYTIQMSAQLLLAGLIGTISGLLAGSFGYQALYWVTLSIGILSIWLVSRLRENETRQGQSN